MKTEIRLKDCDFIATTQLLPIKLSKAKPETFVDTFLESHLFTYFTHGGHLFNQQVIIEKIFCARA